MVALYQQVDRPYLGVATKSGWMNSSIFVDVLKHIQKHNLCSKESPILLLCDNQESHHRLQPLDVGVFGPLKAKLKTSFNDWHASSPEKTLNIYNIPKLANTPYLECFKKTGK